MPGSTGKAAAPARRVTIKDVARLAEVSTAVASRAINGKGDVSEGKRKRALEAAAQLGYVPNSMARGLVKGRQTTIGVIVTDSSSPVYASIVRGIEELANERGFGVLLANSADSQAQALRSLDSLIASRVSGVLIVPTQRDRRDIEMLRGAGMPFVLLLRHFEDDADTDFVITDNVLGAEQVTRHLVELGHRRIGHVAGPPEVSTGQERVTGYRKALEEAGVAPRPELVAHGPYTIEAGQELGARLLALAEPPTAIFAATDRQAIGVMQAVRDKGLTVPEDVAVVGGDDIELAQYLAVPLTTFHQRAREIGREGMQTLLSRMDAIYGDRAGEDAYQQVVLRPELVVRESSGGRRP
ncbi:MAG: LacI family transcriptional regulator [Solirubrobacterales bacterium]|jgi:LacI family transcriptional regulator|nr:LacI family transcriptional regulator [Solirubrobacterales bacterium]